MPVARFLLNDVLNNPTRKPCLVSSTDTCVPPGTSVSIPVVDGVCPECFTRPAEPFVGFHSVQRRVNTESARLPIEATAGLQRAAKLWLADVGLPGCPLVNVGQCGPHAVGAGVDDDALLAFTGALGLVGTFIAPIDSVIVFIFFCSCLMTQNCSSPRTPNDNKR